MEKPSASAFFTDKNVELLGLYPILSCQLLYSGSGSLQNLTKCIRVHSEVILKVGKFPTSSSCSKVLLWPSCTILFNQFFTFFLFFYWIAIRSIAPAHNLLTLFVCWAFRISHTVHMTYESLHTMHPELGYARNERQYRSTTQIGKHTNHFCFCGQLVCLFHCNQKIRWGMAIFYPNGHFSVCSGSLRVHFVPMVGLLDGR